MTPDPSPNLTVSALEVWRGEVCLFTGLDFELRSGDVALVTGPNGSGKTTLLRILAGLAVPVDGSVSWSGTPVDRLDNHTRSQLAYQGHLDGLKRDFTVRENLEFFRDFWGGGAPVEPLLDTLGLNACEDREVRFLSAGQRRRTALGCMRLKQAKLWLLDEPLTNLDAVGTAVVAEWIQAHTAGGGLAVVATHQPEQLAGTATLEIEL